jgi:acetolactate synthase I/III small subunit
MSVQPLESRNPSSIGNERTVIELTVTNHPGIMPHICNLFFRRAYHVEGVLCLPIGCGEQSRIWLLVDATPRLEQMIKQVEKLEDVCDVRCRKNEGEVFTRLAGLISEPSDRLETHVA